MQDLTNKVYLTQTRYECNAKRILDPYVVIMMTDQDYIQLETLPNYLSYSKICISLLFFKAF